MSSEYTPFIGTLFPQPSFFIRIEERMHQIVAVVFWYLEWLGFNTFVQTLQK